MSESFQGGVGTFPPSSHQQSPVSRSPLILSYINLDVALDCDAGTRHDSHPLVVFPRKGDVIAFSFEPLYLDKPQ